MGNKEMPIDSWENSEPEGPLCPMCPEYMVVRLAPLKNGEPSSLELLSPKILWERENDPDVEWGELLVCPSCGFTIFPDEYDDWMRAYRLR